MPTTRTIIRSGAFALALAGGGVAGAMLGAPNLSGAQDEPPDTDDTTADDSTADDGEPREHPFRFRHGHPLEKAAEIIGISVDDLRSALDDGQSIADVAEANGVDPDALVDELVAQALERIAEMEAAVPERVTEMVEKDDWGEHLPGRRGGFPGHGPFGGGPPGAEQPTEDDAAA